MVQIVQVVSSTKLLLDSVNKLLPQQSPSKKDKILTKDELEKCLKNKNFYLLIAFKKGIPVGVGTVFFQKNLRRWIAEIHDVVVDCDYRKQGIGTEIVKKLVTTAKDFAEKNKAKIKLYLTSRPARKEANNLYKKLGFVQVAKAQGSWGTNLYKLIINEEAVIVDIREDIM